MLRTGIPWEYLPREMGCGSGMTWDGRPSRPRRLRDWNEAGVWARLHAVLLKRLAEADAINWDRASVDSATVPAPKGGRIRERIRPTAASSGASATS